ncbi:MAG: DUF5011 domain-containing protein [Sulfurovum sp.]|nr:DUF5011 domain-containing protein [Sulfurovum sp.]
MFKFIKHKILMVLLMGFLVFPTLSVANTISETQLHGVISIITNFIVSSDPKAEALKKVAEYADTNGDSEVPTVEDYSDIGVTGVDARTLGGINTVIASLEGADVDTDTELQAIIDTILAAGPVITLLGSNPMSIGLNATYDEDNATAFDSIDGDVSENIEINGTVDTSIAGVYLIRYNVVDDDSQSATEVVREVNVSSTADTETPVFVPSGDENVSVEENQFFAIDLNATDAYTVRYSISDANSTYFNVDIATGVVTFKEAPNYESGILSYTFSTCK